jgi:hypothetical protein
MSGDPLSKAEAYLAGASLLASSGGVLYSSHETLRPGPVYLLGLNPGGDAGSTLRDSISKSRAGQNAYLDEQWSPGGRLRPKGQATLQKRVQALCASMGLETRAVPASNLVFTRSIRLSALLDFDAALSLCLPVHHIFADAIRPKFLMTFGSIDNFTKAVTITQLESRSAEHDTWNAHRGRATINGQDVIFGNIPHMSVWASDKRPDVVSWVIEALR